MGCDGGTIPKRDELVRKKKNPEKKDKESELSFKWKHCALTQEELRQPIVSCHFGRLYNKEAVIQALLDKNLPLTHIKNLKDIKDLKLTQNGDKVNEYICPASGLEMTGNYRFVFFWTCGCVISERVLKQIETNLCIMCQEPYTENDIVIINGTDDDKVTLEARMTLRKVKKNKKIKIEVDNNAVAGCSSDKNVEPVEVKKEIDETSDQIKEEVVETTTTIVQDEKACGSKSIIERRSVCESKIVKCEKVGTTTTKRQVDLSKLDDPVYKKSRTAYSVSKDPNASNVFKSLFTSHESDKKQERAHWITYNPFYN